MSPNQLREWLFQNSQEDQWWICLDSITDERPVTVTEIAERLKNGQYLQAQALHVSQAGLPNPPWVEVEIAPPLLTKTTPNANPIQVASSVTDRQKKAKIRRHALVAGGLFCILYCASPYYSLWRLRGSLRSGNVDDLEARIDFPSVRESLKDQLRVQTAKNMARDQSLQDNPFGGLATAFAPVMINYAVDNIVTPSGISALIADSKTALKNADSSATTNEEKTPINWSEVHYAFFASPTQFKVNIDKTTLRLGFTGFGWKLKKIEIPLSEP